MSAVHQVLTSYIPSSFIATPTATPALLSSFEGGYYVGLIWNQVCQSTSSVTIATGGAGFVVPNMAATPLFYMGQTVEVRSRANPNNKMVGTIAGAAGTLLAVNVTSTGGSGTYTDWSVMSRYRVIVAPKASGEALKALRTIDAAGPAASGTLSEGYVSTWAQRGAGNSTEYPAAWWATGLTIAGRSDWYIPSRDEMDLLNRSIKPGAESNSVVAKVNAQTYDYKTLGSYGDTTTTQGLNNHTSPTGAAYTAGAPAQVGAGVNFRTGESEAVVYNAGGQFYFTSSAYNESVAPSFGGGNSWRSYISFSGTPNHMEPTYNNNGAGYIRAVRRSII